MTEEVMQKEEEEAYSDAFAEFAEGSKEGDAPNSMSFENDGEAVLDKKPDETKELEETNEAQSTLYWEEKAKALEVEAQDWKHRFQSDAGRVGALQRKINEMEADTATEPLEKPSELTATKDESPPDLAGFKEDYPDIYQGIESYMGAEMQKRTEAMKNEMEQKIAPVSQMIEQQQTAAQLAALDHAHSDWQELANDYSFQAWVREQPEQVQQMANSDFANDVSYVLSAYKTQNQPQTKSNVEGIAQKRERQLRESSNIPSRSSSATTTLAEDDYSSAFKHYAAKK